MGEDYGDIWVCLDCYFAHHYGASEHDGQWFAGDSDTPCDREPLGLWVQDHEFTDNTCSDHEVTYEPVVYADGETDPDGDIAVACPHCGSDDEDNGIDEFSWRSCSGCGSTLGGSRYRLHVWGPTT